MNYARLISNLYRNNPVPSFVSINLTNKCQSACVYCEIGQRHFQSDKPLLCLSDLTWIVDEMKKSRISVLTLHGGEPFLFSGLFEVIEYAYKAGIKCEILTNGLLLPRLSGDEIRTLKKCNTTVFISIDSFNSERNELIRGVKGALELPLKGIEILAAANIPVNISTVVSNYNYTDLYDIVVNANSLGVKSVGFQPVNFVSNFPEVAPINDKINFNVDKNNLDVLNGQFEKIVKFEKENKIKTNVSSLRAWLPYYIKWVSANEKSREPFFKEFIKKFWCASLHNTIYINYYGEILPCVLLKPPASIKSRDGKSLLELYRDSCKPIISLIRKEKYPYECRSCFCQFQQNMYFSTMKYPISNYYLIPALVDFMVKKAFMQ